MASSAIKYRDIGWYHGTQGSIEDSAKYIFMDTLNDGITRHKQHLVGGYKNVK